MPHLIQTSSEEMSSLPHSLHVPHPRRHEDFILGESVVRVKSNAWLGEVGHCSLGDDCSSINSTKYSTRKEFQTVTSGLLTYFSFRNLCFMQVKVTRSGLKYKHINIRKCT